MLVVLLIMGLLVGLASAIVNPDDRGLLRLEAERLARLMDLALSESRYTGTAIAWTADDTGYRFWRRDKAGRWSPVRDNASLRERSLPPGLQLSALRIEDHPVTGPMRLEFTPYGRTYSFDLSLSLGDARFTVAAPPIGETRVTEWTGETHVR